MRIDVQFPGKIVGARPPSAAFCCKKVSIFSEGNTFSLERYLLEELATGRAVGKLSLSVVGITLPIFLELEARCLVEICSEAMAQSDFDKALLPSSQKSSAGNLPSTQKFLDTPLPCKSTMSDRSSWVSFEILHNVDFT
jgi:hypothetical protein